MLISYHIIGYTHIPVVYPPIDSHTHPTLITAVVTAASGAGRVRAPAHGSRCRRRGDGGWGIVNTFEGKGHNQVILA